MGRAEKLKAQRRIEQEEAKTKIKKFWKNFFVYGIVVVVSSTAALGATYLYQNYSKDNPKVDKYKVGEREYSEYPEMVIDESGSYEITIETTEGTMKAELFPESAPKTVNNFVALSRDNFYNGLVFHRIVKDFMIQGGDPEASGSGGPGYKFDDEALGSAEYKRGTLAMANSGPNTNGSQFFIMHQDKPDLPKSYVVFGKLIEGLDVLDKLVNLEVEDNGMGEISKPVNAPEIIKIIVEEK